MIFIKMEMNRTAEIFFGYFIMVSLIVMAIDTLVIIAELVIIPNITQDSA